MAKNDQFYFDNFIAGAALSKKAALYLVTTTTTTALSHPSLSPPHATELPTTLLDKHYRRKHGATAYYGQGGIPSVGI